MTGAGESGARRLVVVVGSVNVDLVVKTDRLPGPGETVLGRSFARHHGGKSANQAVAAARAGSPVRMVACVGDDAFGREARAALVDEGIDTHGILVCDAPTGVAVIAVAPDGENQIVVAPGANGRLRPEDVEGADLSGAVLLVTGLEIPMEAVVAAARRAATAGIQAVVNVAPAVPLPEELLAAGPILVLNEHELGQVAGRGEPDEALASLVERTGSAVVVTRGAQGALLAIGDERHPEPGMPADAVVDTTGAGDAFIGAFAAWLAAGATLQGAIRAGVAAGSLAVGRAGARAGMPHRDELLAKLAATGPEMPAPG